MIQIKSSIQGSSLIVMTLLVFLFIGTIKGFAQSNTEVQKMETIVKDNLEFARFMINRKDNGVVNEIPLYPAPEKVGAVGGMGFEWAEESVCAMVYVFPSIEAMQPVIKKWLTTPPVSHGAYRITRLDSMGIWVYTDREGEDAIFDVGGIASVFARDE